MNRSFWALLIVACLGLTACAVESGEPEVQPATEETDFEGMTLELISEAPTSLKDGAPSTNASCGSWGGWSSNGSRWCGGTGLSCLREGSIGIYTRESRSKQCCSPGVACWYEYEYQDKLLQCGC